MSSRPSRGAARLAAILDALPDGLVLVNANGTVVNANTIALEMFETPGTALVGRGLLDLLPEFDSKLIPGSMRRPESADARGRTKPTRMTARRTDSTEFPVEVTSASLEDGRDAYNDIQSYTGDELLMLVVRDLSGTVDTEAELARSQRQTEMILRAASEGVVGTDTDGRVVLVNPAAAQILGFRATDLGGRELHTLVVHSRADGEPFPYEDSPLADTLRSGRKHRVRGQVLWAKNGSAVPVDLTTAPVRDGDQLVGAVMTFTDRRAHEELLKQHTDELTEANERHAAELKDITERLGAELAETTERQTAELADRSDRYAAEIEELTERYNYVAARHAQLTAVLGESLRGPLEELRGELATLAADQAGQLWPEANQILHHLAAGYSRMTTLVDNVLGYQRLDDGTEQLTKMTVLLDGVVAAGVEGAIELIGPGRAQFAVHAPPIEAEVDPGRLATALAHLVADVAGVDSTGRARMMPAGGYVDSTIVVAAAQRGNVVRIEVRGPFPGGDPVHEPIVRGIVRAHGGVLQTHEVPGMSGSAYVLELPLGEGSGTVPPPAQPPQAQLPEQQGQQGQQGQQAQQGPVAGPDTGTGTSTAGTGTSGGGRRRARRASTDAFLDAPAEEVAGEPTGRRRARAAQPGQETPAGGVGPVAAQDTGGGGGVGAGGGGTGRRRGRPNPAEEAAAPPGAPQGPVGTGPVGTGSAVALPSAPASEGSVVTSAEGAHPTGRAARGAAVPPRGVPVDAASAGTAPAGHRAQQQYGGQNALPALTAGPVTAAGGQHTTGQHTTGQHTPGQHPTGQEAAGHTAPGRRARRALAPAQERHVPPPPAPAGADAVRSTFALPPAEADRAPADPGPVPGSVPGPRTGAGPDASLPGRHDIARVEPDEDHTPPQAHPLPARRPLDPNGWSTPAGPQEAGLPPDGTDAAPGTTAPGMPTSSGFGTMGGRPGWPDPAPGDGDNGPGTSGPQSSVGPPTADSSAPHPARAAHQPLPPAQPLPEEAPAADSAQGRAYSVRTLGQGVPFVQQIAKKQAQSQNQTQGQQVQSLHQAQAQQAQQAQSQPSQQVQGRHVPAQHAPGQHAPAQHPAQDHSLGGQGQSGQSGTLGSGRRRKLGSRSDGESAEPDARSHPQSQDQPAQGGGSRLAGGRPEGRSYAIGAPDEGAEGPEPLDGPGGAVEVANRPQPQPVDDELPPEPLDNPRRLLVWPAPDVSTSQALSDRGYRPVVVHSREEVAAQIAAFPAALFVDPLTGPITRTALQSLRQAAVAAEVPVLVTAGLGQATREAAYGADPAVLLKALAPRDSEQHPPRVLLIEEHEEIAIALTATLERRGMQVARAADDNEAVALAAQMRPNLVVMDLMQVRRQRAGIIDWLRSNGQLNRTPLVVYTSAGIDPAELPRLTSGETVLFLAERSTSVDVQSRIVELLAKIGTN